ncbi:hypothetical protein H6G89_09280 [Oscillatoria sp. FACHB-1407]|uniref:hypothetical protein n=1 Tax=Oscillatoria sp. FACHB-1407 TaxID=2692847 RepID=UPI0016850005|nr:hypothetical protein [Oscillatoria sp. FACHB-1407]MBD2461236.1 hypothetical protein [Oscillatoria sp. FACHB-1407]
MHITLHTDKKLVLQISENQFLAIALQVGGTLIGVSILMFSADFTTNPDYSALSAQNLNSFVRFLGVILAMIGVSCIGFATNNRHQSYTFDKESGLLTVQGKGIARLLRQEYPLSSIREVIVGQTESTPPASVTENYSVISVPDEYWIYLEFEDSFPRIFLQYRSSDQQTVNELANAIRQFLGHPLVSSVA